MQTAILLLWAIFPVFQEDQQADNIRSTQDLRSTQRDSVEVPTAPLTVELPNADYVDINDLQPRSFDGSFQLSWNDDISDEESYPKTCDIKLTDVDSTLNGSFVGPVEGRERDAIITGRLEGTGQTRILTFQQRESGYVCSYQGIDDGGEITGVWHDTQNRSGRFRLLKYQ